MFDASHLALRHVKNQLKYMKCSWTKRHSQHFRTISFQKWENRIFVVYASNWNDNTKQILITFGLSAGMELHVYVWLRMKYLNRNVLLLEQFSAIFHSLPSLVNVERLKLWFIDFSVPLWASDWWWKRR